MHRYLIKPYPDCNWFDRAHGIDHYSWQSVFFCWQGRCRYNGRFPIRRDLASRKMGQPSSSNRQSPTSRPKRRLTGCQRNWHSCWLMSGRFSPWGQWRTLSCSVLRENVNLVVYFTRLTGRSDTVPVNSQTPRNCLTVLNSASLPPVDSQVALWSAKLAWELCHLKRSPCRLR